MIKFETILMKCHWTKFLANVICLSNTKIDQQRLLLKRFPDVIVFSLALYEDAVNHPWGENDEH